MPLVCGGEPFVVAARSGFGTVVFQREREPFLIFEIVEHPACRDKPGKQFKLLTLGAAHLLYEINDIIHTAFAPVESTDLEHTPEGALHGAYGVNLACRLKTRILSSLI